MTEGFEVASSSYGVFCECGRQECIERLDVPIEVFDEICSDGRLFLVTAGHEPDIGAHVVEANGAYRVVRAVA